MSVQIMSKVWSDESIQNRSELLVLLALADHANDSGVCFPSIESIAKKSRLSQRGAQETIQKLKRDGKLEVEIGKGRNGTNVYRVVTGGCSGRTPQIDVGISDGHLHPNHKESPGTVITSTNSNKSSGDFVSYPTNLYTEEFRKAWEEWHKYRKERRAPLTPMSTRKQLNMLSSIGVSAAIECINRSITNGWTGLFPPKKDEDTPPSEHHIRRGGKWVDRRTIGPNI